MYKTIIDRNKHLSKHTLYPEFDFPGDDSDGFSIYSCSFDYSSSLWYLINNLANTSGTKNYDSIIKENIDYGFGYKEKPTTVRDWVNYEKQTNLLSASSISGSFVLGIKQQYIGNRIKQNTFTFNDTANNKTYADDGYGNIISGSTKIGNIFYETGIISVYDDISTGAGNFNFTYSCINDIYEQSWLCEINESELNSSTNPTSYVSGSQVIKHVGDVYFTTIGLYNQYNELLLTSRLANPLKRDFVNDVSIKVKLDM